MKKLIILILCFSVAHATLHAQARRRTNNNASSKAKLVADSIANAQRVADSLATAKRVADSVAAKDQQLAAAGELKFGLPKPSMRNDNAVELNAIRDRVPLVYQYIREDNAIFREKIWRVIDTHEKMNLPFAYKGDENNGSQMFVNILLNAINPKYPRPQGEQPIMAFTDDRFSTPVTFQEITEKLVGKPHWDKTADLVKDPTGATTKDTLISEEFNPDDIYRFKVMEEYVFDKNTSRLFIRILGVAPMKIRFDVDAEGNKIPRDDGFPLFWVYYPDIRGLLAKYEAYNPKNLAARRNWDQVFEDHYFSSFIVKSSSNNPKNQELSGYINDPLFRLLEGEKIKEKIFNYEQDLWEY